MPLFFFCFVNSWVWEADGAVWASGGAGCRQGGDASLSDPPRFGFQHCYAAEETEGLQWRVEDARCSGQVNTTGIVLYHWVTVILVSPAFDWSCVPCPNDRKTHTIKANCSIVSWFTTIQETKVGISYNFLCVVTITNTGRGMRW